MKLIAIPTRDGMVDDHFGHCAYYTVVTLDDQNQVVKQERLDSPEGAGDGHHPHAGWQHGHGSLQQAFGSRHRSYQRMPGQS